MKKYYRISDLINDYIKLKEEFEKYKKESIQNTINMLELCKSSSIDIDKLINGFKEQFS